MDDFPLDIPYGEISQWLASRRKLPNDWIKRLRTLESQTSTAFKSLPAAFASNFDIEEDGWVGYLTAKKIRDALAETAERGYFGGLSGEAGTWDKLVKGYEKGQLYLGEAGQRILKNVDYEMPFVKKRMDGLEKRAAELSRRRSEHEAMAITAANNFTKECENLGIKGQELHKEIQQLGDGVFDAIAQGMMGLKGTGIMEAAMTYRKMRTDVHDITGDALMMFQKVVDDEVDPPDREMIKAMSTTEHTNRAAVDATKETDLLDSSVGIEIDWDVIPTEGGPTEDAPTEDGPTEVGPTEWMDDGGIDWDIALEEPDVMQSTDSTSMDIAPSSSSVDRGPKDQRQDTAGDGDGAVSSTEPSPDVLRFVWDAPFRNALLDDLYELQAFLTVRSTADASDVVSLAHADMMHRYDAEEASVLLKNVDDVLHCFVGDDVQRRLMIQTSTAYADRLLTELIRSAKREQKWKDAAVQVDQERQSVQLEHSQLNIRLGKLKRQTMELKTMVETDIAPLFDNRQINVMGKINTVLS